VRIDEEWDTSEVWAKPAWMRDALCREHPEVNFFPAPLARQSLAPAIAVCRRCPVLGKCLGYALADPRLRGIWGGTSERQRARIRRIAACEAP
jgi:WhiB family redox-sensing transcriptional regulator